MRGRLERDRVESVVRPVVVHSARTAVAAVASVLVARLFRLPEAYWAPITTLVITQSSLGAALSVSWQRLVGTAPGAVVAAMVASLFGPSLFVFGASIFMLGLLCAITRSDRSAYRFAGVTLAVVLLIPRPNPAWQIAVHRFAEVSIGIAVALILALVWPERDTKRVFVLGYSNGGQMAFRLAIETPDEVAAVAALGASLPTPDSSSCAQRGRTARVMLANGTLDPINPYEGGKVTMFGFGYRGTALSSRASADQFAQRNGITTARAATQLPHLHKEDPTSVDSLTWSSGDHTHIAVLYTVHGGGHVVPQPAFRYPRMLGRTAGDLDAPSSALQFFGL